MEISNSGTRVKWMQERAATAVLNVTGDNEEMAAIAELRQVDEWRQFEQERTCQIGG